MRWTGVVAIALTLAGCATRAPENPQDRFLARLSALCGKAFAGRVVSTDPADAAMAGQSMVMHVRDCAEDQVAIPFQVGNDRSRTWVIRRTTTGLQLKHDHRHADGSSDEVTMYGGDTILPGTAEAQAFPVDAESIALFTRTGRAGSNTNVWHVTVTPDRFTYALRRANRHFEVAFDLTQPVPAPPPPWGATR